MSAVPSTVHVLDSRGCLTAGHYASLCWPFLERMTAAVVISGLNTAEAAHGSKSAVDRWDLREAVEHGEITVKQTSVIVTDARFRPLTTLSQGDGASTADDPDDGHRCVGV